MTQQNSYETPLQPHKDACVIMTITHHLERHLSKMHRGLILLTEFLPFKLCQFSIYSFSWDFPWSLEEVVAPCVGRQALVGDRLLRQVPFSKVPNPQILQVPVGDSFGTLASPPWTYFWTKFCTTFL